MQGAPQVPRLHLGLLLEERRDHSPAGECKKFILYHLYQITIWSQFNSIDSGETQVRVCDERRGRRGGRRPPAAATAGLRGRLG